MSLPFLRSFLRHPLTPANPIGPLLRYLRWQLTARITGRSLKFRFVNGTHLIARRGWPAVTACWYFGLPEFETMAFLGHVLRNGDLFCDVGAHCGTYTVLAAAVGAEVVAIEPHPGAFGYLQDHIRLNAFDRKVSSVQIALGSENGTAVLSAHGQQSHILTEENHAARFQVKMQPLDEVLREHSPVAIKIDVEGYEAEVLKGAQNTLRKTSLKIVCIETMGLGERYGTGDKDVMAKLKTAGFYSVSYNAFKRGLSSSDRHKHMQIFVRENDWIQNRVKTARSLRVYGRIF